MPTLDQRRHELRKWSQAFVKETASHALVLICSEEAPASGTVQTGKSETIIKTI